MLKKYALTVIASALGFAVFTGGSALAEGDAAAGAKVFNKCKACHILAGPAKRMGPTLECVIGRTSGTVEGYRYSKAMTEAGIVWGHDTLAEFLANPRAAVPRTKMAFPGVKNEAQLEDLVAYLEAETAGENCPG